MTKLTRTLVPVLLLLILALAAGLRLYNINWDNGTYAHPDERSTVVFYAPTITWPDDSADLLDPRESTLNPFWDVGNQSRRSYTYGHFPLYTLVLVGHGLHSLGDLAVDWSIELPAGWLEFLQRATSGEGFAQIGRVLSGLSDVGTVLLLFLIGRRLYGPWGGILAALLSTFTVLQIQLAHFFAVDPISTTFTLLAIYGGMLMFDRRSVGAAILTGVGIGLAVASKFSGLPIAFVPFAVAILAVLYRRADDDIPSLVNHMLMLAFIAGAVAFGIFAITSPFVLLDFENFRRAVIEEQGNMVRGIADFPFTRQYRNTTAYIYFIDQQLQWGMGYALGLLALVGTVWVGVKALMGKAAPGEWLALGWIVLYFGPTGLFLAKFMRYMIPVVPLFTLFGAGLIVALWHWRMRPPAEDEPPPPLTPFRIGTRVAAVALALTVTTGAGIWSLAFVNGVYGTEHTWVTFSRWVYDNVPDGSCIAYEHWDDRLPVNLPEPNAHSARYQQPQLPMYEEDTAQKYDLIRNTLMSCDYVVLATNRLWRTIPRLPERYPMSTRYYEALFSGELGFEQVHTVETPPRLGPWTFDDQPADESFTVYDHPKPILFKKTEPLTLEEWDAVLGGTWEGAIPRYTGHPTLLMRLLGNEQSHRSPPNEREEGLSLILETPVSALPVVDDYRWNTFANESTVAAVAIWWLAVMLVGVLAMPITYVLFHQLPDRGYALGKSLGLLLISYFVWMNSSLGLLGNRFSTVIVALVVLGGISLWIMIRWRESFFAYLRHQAWVIFAVELIFFMVFFFFLYLRIMNPDLWQPWLGGEKMMEIGFLNAVVKSAEMPPYDPFFAEGVMNYYYYGLFMVGLLIKLTGIAPEIAFNLAVPMLAALAAVNAFSLATNLALAGMPFRVAAKRPPQLRMLPFSAGFLAILFVLFIGNLEGAAQFMRNLSNLSTSTFTSAVPGLETAVKAADGIQQTFLNGVQPITYNYWDPTRVIPFTINEFPYFSFLFADLHPHMMNIPFTILMLSVAYNWINKPRPPHESQTETTRAESLNEPATPPTDNPQPGEAAITYRTQPALAMPTGGQLLMSESAGALSGSVNQSYDDTKGSTPPLASYVRTWTSSLGEKILRWLALPFVLGALAAINTWDLPTYLGLMLATFVLARYRPLDGGLNLARLGSLTISGLLFVGSLIAGVYVLYAPFFLNYQTMDVGLGFVHTQTEGYLHLKIWGFFVFIVVTWLWISFRHPGTRHSILRAVSLGLRRWNVLPHMFEVYRRVVGREIAIYQSLVLLVLALGAASLALAFLGYTVPAYLLPLLVGSLVLLFRREVSPATNFLGLMAFTSLLVLMGVEFVFLRDFLGGGDYYRMNTLFKFFTQIWVILAIFAAVTFVHLWEWAWRWPWPIQIIWRGAALVLIVATLVYPIYATPTRLDDRFRGPRPPIGTLDGLAYMTVGSFDWPADNRIDLTYDYEAIRWLQDNITGTPILAEAKIGYYREGGMRVAAYTGLPSILGGLHQNEQRYGWQIGERDFPVNQFWTNPDPTQTLALMDELNIDLIYVGQVEQATYGTQIGQKFAELADRGHLALIFSNQKTQIYQRIREQ